MTDAADESTPPPHHQAASSEEPQLRFGLQFQVGAIALLEALCLLFSISTISSTCTFVGVLQLGLGWIINPLTMISHVTTFGSSYSTRLLPLGYVK